ncbi:nucleolin 2-like [Papaver somniferum]|uniref:nucleolin 2-like n=1 Tax=Papaver somniferum TaxID=3469 RepID=UPI000E6F4BF2|nr:nucleolin 2-like [Papaver somniferum]
MVIGGGFPMDPPVSRPDEEMVAALVMIVGVMLEEILGVAAPLDLVIGGVTPEGTPLALLVLVLEDVTPCDVLTVLEGGTFVLTAGKLAPGVLSAPVASSSSDEDFKASAAKSKNNTNHAEGEKPNIPLNDRRVTYAELMKRKAEDDEADDRRRRKDRTRRRILAAEERRRFDDGVPSDSDASEDESVCVPRDRKIKPDLRTKELREIAKRVEDEAEEESDDPNIHPDFINGPDSDSDEEEDSEKDNDDESDKSDNSDESDEYLYS